MQRRQVIDVDALFDTGDLLTMNVTAWLSQYAPTSRINYKYTLEQLIEAMAKDMRGTIVPLDVLKTVALSLGYRVERDHIDIADHAFRGLSYLVKRQRKAPPDDDPPGEYEMV
jgi:hypothetical protein